VVLRLIREHDLVVNGNPRLKARRMTDAEQA
jgi:hypothetical protein